MEWQPIEAAPKDGTPVLVYYDHAADPYHDPDDPDRLTDYAANAEGCDFLDGKGQCVAFWSAGSHEIVDEYGDGFWVPGCWFMWGNDDYAVAATRWQPLPEPPK